jgi:uncharacterized protein (DUF4415 family)
MSNKKPVVFDDDNPEWSEEDFARAQGPETLSAAELAAFPRTKARIGRPKSSNKELVTLRIDRDVLARFKAEGAGWQTRINEALRKAAG